MGVRENTYNNQVFVHSHWGCMQHASTWLLPHKRQLLAVPWTGSQYACNVRVGLVGWNYHNLLCFYSWNSTLCYMCKERTGFNKVSSCPVFTFGKKKLPVSINVNINKTTKQNEDDNDWWWWWCESCVFENLNSWNKYKLEKYCSLLSSKSTFEMTRYYEVLMQFHRLSTWKCF